MHDETFLFTNLGGEKNEKRLSPHGGGKNTPFPNEVEFLLV